ncbi:MAG: 3'-5' exonuclease, partial [Nitrososphaerales archaeon]
MVSKSDLTQRIREQSKDTTSLEPSLLVSATYDGERKVALLKFYHPVSQRIYLWSDNTGHKPYCYTKLMPEELPNLKDRKDIRGIERTKKYDLLNDQEIELTKIIAEDPLAIGGTTTEKSVRNLVEVWEADIKYHENYLYDNGFIVGTYYSINEGKLAQHSYKVTEQVELALKSLVWDKITESIGGDGDNESRKYITEWAKLLNQPIPEIKRAALDIEVVSEEERIPDAKAAENEVIAVSFVGSDNLHEAFVLKRQGVELGKNEMEDHIKVTIFDNEKELLRAVFDRMLDYPFIITFNGDNF